MLNQKCLWTPSRARLCQVTQNPGIYNWVFVPGGPGLGSESLVQLTQGMDLPGASWHFDFPGDGSNRLNDDDACFEQWFASLVEATQILDNVILVGHSTGGMLILSTPELEERLSGLVLIASSPTAEWQNGFATYVAAHPIHGIDRLMERYAQLPSDDLLKQITIMSASYVAREDNVDAVVSLFQSLPFNYRAHQWSEKNFDATYTARWTPQTLTTLIMSGDQDHLTPLTLFSQRPEFLRSNIVMHQIHDAAHFPWLDNKEQVKKLFHELSDRIAGSIRK